MIRPSVQKILQNVFLSAISFLNIPSYKYRLVFERKGVHLNNDDVCVADNAKRVIYIDEDWANHCVEINFEYDLHFLMAHEARHIYQFVMMERLRKKKEIKEPVEVVQSWIINEMAYKRDVGDDTKAIYKSQPVEVDANAFASFFVMMRYNESPSFSKEAEDLEKKRLYEIAAFYGATITEDADDNNKSLKQAETLDNNDIL